MSTNRQRTEQAFKVGLGLLLALLAYQGRLICEHVSTRLDRLERQQMQILVQLGIPPVAGDTLETGVKPASFCSLQEIKRIKLTPHPEIRGVPLDTRPAVVVNSP